MTDITVDPTTGWSYWISAYTKEGCILSLVPQGGAFDVETIDGTKKVLQSNEFSVHEFVKFGKKYFKQYYNKSSK